MPREIKSTLVEMQLKLSEVLFKVLQGLDSTNWQTQSQIVYSGVDEWDTAYNAYLTANDIEEVKFPFCTLTREETQIGFSQWNSPITLHEIPGNNESSVAGMVIRPVQCKFNWTIYQKDHIEMENIIDSLIVFGSECQEFKFFSEILKQESEFSFYFDAPTHTMIPNKEERLRGRGHIFSVTVPITVECLLGISKDQKTITEIIAKIILESSGEVICEETITDQNNP